MALTYADRVQETTTTTGTGTYDLGGAVTGFQGFVAGVGTGNTCYYCATDGTDWEVGLGTVTDASPDTLSRDTILSSSNAGAAVSWSAGSKDVFLVLPAAVPSVASCGVAKTGSTSFTNNSGQYITFTAETWDRGGMVDLGANADRITLVVGGTYQVCAHAVWDANGTGMRYLQVERFNSADVSQETKAASMYPTNANNSGFVSNAIIVNAAAGDYIKVYAVQGSGGSLNLLSATLTAVRVTP